MTDMRDLLEKAEAIKQAAEEVDTELCGGGADMLGVLPGSYLDTTSDLFIAGRRKAGEMELAPLMAALLAYSEELCQRIESAQSE